MSLRYFQVLCAPISVIQRGQMRQAMMCQLHGCSSIKGVRHCLGVRGWIGLSVLIGCGCLRVVGMRASLCIAKLPLHILQSLLSCPSSGCSPQFNS